MSTALGKWHQIMKYEGKEMAYLSLEMQTGAWEFGKFTCDVYA